MKTTLILLCLALVSWGANAQMDHSKMEHSGNSMSKMHSDMPSKMKDKSTVSPSITVEHSLSVSAIINNYLSLKNALAEDDGKKAAGSGKLLFDALGKYNIASQSKAQQKDLKDILDDAEENAEHISKSGNDIDHQREHFDVLGTDIKDLIVITGSDRTLYQLFCPMYNNKKGAIWLNENKEIKNPFFGSKMPKCGSVQQEISVK